MNGLLEQFLVEARELVADAAVDLVALESGGDDLDRIDRIFRAFHTLKGGAAMANLPIVVHALHAGEDVLAALRKRDIAGSPGVVDGALRCLDQVGAWLDEIEASNGLSPQAAAQAEGIAKELRRHLPQSGEPMRLGPDAEPDWIGPLVAGTRGLRETLGRDPGRAVAVEYEPNANCFFDGDDPVRLLRKIPRLLALRIQARTPWPPLPETNPYECNLIFRALSLAPRAEIAEIFRLLPDQVRLVEFTTDAFRAGAPERISSQDVVVRVLQAQRDLLGVPGSDKVFGGRVGAAARSAINVLRFAGTDSDVNRIERARDESVAERDPGPMLRGLEGILAAYDSRVGASTRADAPGSPASAPVALSVNRSFRVDEAKVDHLVNVASELIVARNSLNELAARIVADLGDGPIARDLKSQNAALDRLASETHSAVVRLRMVPLAQVFRRFPRIARDTANELGKSVACTASGEDTDADKSIVDAIFEPLLHLVRNAVGHGIESPDERRAAGKCEAGQLRLAAFRRAEQLVVEVTDDGRGIDPGAVRRKARELSLLSEDDLSALSDEEAMQLVFSAGFSTASEVSQISGRGVGLAVVRRVAEGMGGAVSVSSEPGRGTTARLTLPLRMALVRIMTVESGGQVFGVPIDSIAETVRLPRERIVEVRSGQAFVLRDQVIPTRPLSRVLDLPASECHDGARDALILVTSAAGQPAGVEVDGIGERLDVVMKPMEGILAEASGYAGTTLLGNGRVLLVLNLGVILQ